MSDDLESAFPGLTKKYKVAYSTRNKRKYSKISLNLSAATKTKCDQSNAKEDQHITDHLRNEEILDDVTWEEFFSETHENQGEKIILLGPMLQFITVSDYYVMVLTTQLDLKLSHPVLSF